MRKKIVISTLGLLVLVSASFFFRTNEVTVYLGIANAELNELPIKVSIDEKEIFKGSIANNPFKYELLKTKLSPGIHSLSIITDSGYREEKDFFVLLNQHLVIEYYSPCEEENKQCFDVRNMFRKFRLE